MKQMTCPYCGMPIQVRPLSFAGGLVAWRVTCKFCLNQCTLDFWVRIAAGVAGLASVAVAATLLILFINTYSGLVAAHQHLFITLLTAVALILVAGGQALSVVICSKYGVLVKRTVL